ncbi:carboxypeptidase regulatory-like domain-containing protein [Polycladomyces sp. WAk]|uniref:Carboxypeptidase regulatory-like domain-containing protein n=1 Tax=Polycladomyces zharkentensis TaxID=2807616 RepID=A0ABS2WKJ1_9BACL|nr:carboxypeptidase-like regulatory domain-containing protein [Polycladomyces sp. WAk]MBN2909998.1 carboxypeptidase regulatory-like domain-containing protein [Polycladomyces sp. WAk]
MITTAKKVGFALLMLCLIPLLAFCQPNGKETPTNDRDHSQGNRQTDLDRHLVTVTGKVTDTDVRPISKAKYSIDSIRTEVPFSIPEMLYYTDNTGTFTDRLPPGRYKYTFFKEGYETHEQTIEVKKGRNNVFTFRLKKKSN